jgi:hypothetical protein
MGLWKNPFARRPKFLHPSAPQLAIYKLGKILNGGAELAGYIPKTELTPLYMYRGPGRLACTLSVLQPVQLWVDLSIPIAGVPTVAGQYILQPLAPTPDGQSGT